VGEGSSEGSVILGEGNRENGGERIERVIILRKRGNVLSRLKKKIHRSIKTLNF
jgi:hypothetical protein